MDARDLIDEEEMEETAQEPILKDDMDAEKRLQEIQRWEAYRDRMIKHFTQQIELVKDKAQKRIDWNKHLLREYFQTVPHDSTKTQESYPLPSGKLIMKRGGEKLVKPDKDEERMLLLWLAENGIDGYEKKKTEISLDWAGYKKRLQIVDGKAVDKETGEFVDVKVEQVEPTFDVKRNDDDEAKENGNGEGNQVA